MAHLDASLGADVSEADRAIIMAGLSRMTPARLSVAVARSQPRPAHRER
jgi:hypothetical protein